MSRPVRNNRALTILELLIAISASGLLVIGMTSSMFIALQATDKSTTPSDATLEGSRVLMEMALDLNDAVSLTTEASAAIAAYVPDRDTDLSNELVQYVWSGTAGDAVYRVSGSNDPSMVVDDVHEFLLEYPSSPTGRKQVNVSIQVTDNAAARVETAFLLQNM